ncbi:MAG: type IX secretion system membrane protein PorP/SprF, partial [Saprospiraceae bacterium]
MRVESIFCWLLILVAFETKAQQLPQYSLFAHNPFAFNPAAAGSEDDLIASALYRRQWVDLEGAPTT